MSPDTFRRTRHLMVIGAIGFGWTAAAAAQTAPAATLSESLRAHVKGERYDIVTSIRGLPLGVRDQLQALWQSPTLDIAEPGAAFQGMGSRGGSAVPARRLIAAGCSLDNHCLVHYERGGQDHAWLAVLYHWTPAESRLELGGTVPAGLDTVDAVKNAILSGRLGRNERW